MSLQAIVKVLGGDLYDGGRRANIPAPNHSANDRSVSLLLQGDRVVVHTFGDGDWKTVLDDLRGRGLIDQANIPTSGHVAAVGRRPGAAGAAPRERVEAALRLWDAAVPLGRTLSARHCRLRGVARDLPGPGALRHLAEAPVSAYRPGRHRRPALLAGVQDADGRYVAVEITYLDPNARRAVDLRLSRKTVGAAPSGTAVRLDPLTADMLVAEGVFTTLSASEWFGLPAWALMSTRNLRAWTAPPEVRSVLIAADRGRDGEGSAETLRRRLTEAGVMATVALPPPPWGDWNEWSVRATLRSGGRPSVDAAESTSDPLRP